MGNQLLRHRDKNGQIYCFFDFMLEEYRELARQEGKEVTDIIETYCQYHSIQDILIHLSKAQKARTASSS